MPSIKLALLAILVALVIYIVGGSLYFNNATPGGEALKMHIGGTASSMAWVASDPVLSVPVGLLGGNLIAPAMAKMTYPAAKLLGHHARLINQHHKLRAAQLRDLNALIAKVLSDYKHAQKAPTRETFDKGLEAALGTTAAVGAAGALVAKWKSYQSSLPPRKPEWVSEPVTVSKVGEAVVRAENGRATVADANLTHEALTNNITNLEREIKVERGNLASMRGASQPRSEWRRNFNARNIKMKENQITKLEEQKTKYESQQTSLSTTVEDTATPLPSAGIATEKVVKLARMEEKAGTLNSFAEDIAAQAAAIEEQARLKSEGKAKSKWRRWRKQAPKEEEETPSAEPEVREMPEFA